GCQPDRARTDCESSSADRNSCEMNGLYLSPKAESWTSATDEQGAAAPFPWSDGLAQASHASAATSLMEFVTRSVSSIMRPRSRTPASLTPTVSAIDSSCPALCRASASCFLDAGKTWMAGIHDVRHYGRNPSKIIWSA